MIFKRINSGLGRGLVSLARVYQSSLGRYLGGHCRFVPSCSEYFIEAVKRYGPWRGTGKGVWRVLRCHPLGKGGVDWP